MRRIRISLRALILLVTAIGLYLGAREWRRQSVEKLCAQIEEDSRLDGYIYILPNDWLDKLWQRKPIMAKTYTSKSGSEYVAGLVYRAREDVYSVINDDEVIDLLKKLDVVDVSPTTGHADWPRNP
jgi:hypothetical protein